MSPNDIFLSNGINFLTGCATQLVSQFDAKVAAAGVDAEKWHQRSKDLQTRVVESFSVAARRLASVPRNLDTLRTILSDQVFIGQVASALIGGELQPDRFAAELAQRDPTIETSAGIKEIAVALIEAFHAIIASDPELSALVGLRRSEELKRDLRNVSGEVAEIKRGVMDLQVRPPADEQLANLTREIREVPTAVVEALQRFGIAPLALESPLDGRLNESIKRRFENALNELKTGSVAVAAQEFRNLLPDLSADRPEEKTLLFRTTANLGIALYYLGETKAAEEHFDRALELNADSVRAKANKVL